MEYRYDAKEKGNNSYEGQKRRRRRGDRKEDSQEDEKGKTETAWVNFDIKI